MGRASGGNIAGKRLDSDLMRMRLRLSELMSASDGLKTPYAVAKASGGRIARSTIYRIQRSKGHVANFDNDLLEALCDVFKVGPGELLERDAAARPAAKRTAKARRR